VGAYEPDRLSNLGIGHGAIDAGGGYTYFNPETGREASATLGFTYNFENTDTDYKNGVDMHLDWGASQFLNEHFFVGAVGYYYQQLTDDSGSGATLGPFKSRARCGGATDWLSVPDWRQDAGRHQREGILGVCRREPARRLEHVDRIGDLAGGAEEVIGDGPE
jgi:hypothetical protein